MTLGSHTYCGLFLRLFGTASDFSEGMASSQTPGAWASIFASLGPNGIGVSCGQNKWDKAKCYLQELQEELSSAMKLRFKPLVQKKGVFLFIHNEPTLASLHS